MVVTDAQEFDVEVDVEDLPDAPTGVVELGHPSVVVENLHVTYNVIGATGKRAGSADSKTDGFIKKFMSKGKAMTGGHRQIHAIRGVSFTAHHGESIGIIGTNGSGKSTLLQALAGLLSPSQGEVYVSAPPSLLGVSAVLMKDLTGERNVLIGGLALGLSKVEVEDRLDEIVDFSGIGDAIHLPMKTYSAGMGARLRFAISTVTTPDILMIDEALATGDAGFRERSRVRVDEIREQAGTVFVVSHSLASIKAMCTRAIWIDKGQIRMDGDAESVTAAYHEFTRAGA